jgi:periplasmic divalent cation tolerance protein
MSGPEYLQISTTTATRADAERIVDALLSARLVACGQILGPLTSRYWWNGALEQSEEYLILLKLRASAYPQCERAIRERHPYETPEILAVPIVAGSTDYLDWLRANTAAPQAPSLD